MKMHHPRCSAMPGAATFALEFISRLQKGVKNQSQRGKADGGDVPRKILRRNRAIAIFLHAQIALGNLVDLDQVLVFACLARGLETHWAEGGMLNLFGSRVPLHILDEF